MTNLSPERLGIQSLGVLFLIASCAFSAGTEGQKGSVFLKLLEPIAPQKSQKASEEAQEPEEMVTSDLGELLKDPKNEALKAVKVRGKPKRLEGVSKKFTQITWQEVALETSQDKPFLKEPVQKPLESSFVQTADSVESGTPIEAKGDVDSLLAAARTLMIRAQKQGFKGQGLSTKEIQNLDPSGGQLRETPSTGSSEEAVKGQGSEAFPPSSSSKPSSCILKDNRNTCS